MYEYLNVLRFVSFLARSNCLYIKYIPPTFTASALPLALKEDGAGACAVGVEVAVTKE